jgi:branched-chain amino acid transport system permease protein
VSAFDRIESWRVAAALAVLLLLAPLVPVLTGQGLHDRVVTELLINVVLVVGLQTFVGNTGIISFGHAAFMGIGAYASVLITLPAATRGMVLPNLYAPLAAIEGPFAVGLLVGGVVAAAVAAAVGYPLMRLSGNSAAIATFALLVIVQGILLNWPQVTRGTSPLFGVPDETTRWIAYATAVAVIAFAAWFRRSQIGLQVQATREDDRAAGAAGVNVIRVRWISLVLSAGITGVGGALWAHFITAFAPDAFFLAATFSILTMLVIGGMRTVSGAVVGTIAITLVFRALRAVESGVGIAGQEFGPFIGMTQLVLALAMLLILIYRPGGIMGDSDLRLAVPGRLQRDRTSRDGDGAAAG